MTDTSTFSSLRKATFNRAIEHPLTLYPAAVGILGALGIALFGSSIIGGVAVTAGFGVGIANWCTQYFLRADKAAADQIKEARDRLEAKKRGALVEIEARLKKCIAANVGKEFADQALKQLRMIQKRLDTLQGLLDDKFSPSEFTYGRYFVAGQQTTLAVIDNLESVASRLQSIETIDMDYNEERVKALTKTKSLSAADKIELKTINERSALRTDQLSKVDEILTFNETAITEFDRVNTAIAEVKGKTGQASVNLDTAIRELETLVKRAKGLTV